MLCLLLHFGNASFWFIVVSILKLNPRFCKSGDTTYCLARYMLKYPCNYKLGRSRGRTSECFCNPKFGFRDFVQIQSLIKIHVEGRIA